MAVQLAPVPAAVGVFPHFISGMSETLVLREKVMSLTGDSFEIKFANGQPFIKVEGKVMSISGRKTVRDMQGQHLFDICKEHFHIHSTYGVEDASGKKIMEVKSKFQLMGSKAVATFTSHTGKAESLVMKGNWFDTAADIVEEGTGVVVARIDRKVLSGRDMLFGQQTYALAVAPGVDKALMVGMCICMDEKNNEK